VQACEFYWGQPVVKVKTEPLPPVGAATVHTGCGIISPSLLLRTSLGEAIQIMWIAAEEVFIFGPTHLLPSLMLYYLMPAIIAPIFPAFVEMTTLRPFPHLSSRASHNLK
jgi:hypothetical protein